MNTNHIPVESVYSEPGTVLENLYILMLPVSKPIVKRLCRQGCPGSRSSGPRPHSIKRARATEVVMFNSEPAVFGGLKSPLTAEEEMLIYHYRAYLDRILLILLILLKNKMLPTCSFMAKKPKIP